MYETSKSIQRRLHDANFLSRYFVGNGIDIGAGPDSLQNYTELFPLISSVRSWDRPDGDAEAMLGCADDSFDFVHSSHCLEHMRDPQKALANWFRILRPGGHMIVLVPDEDMYEQGVFPSTFNSDHKWTFTVFKERSWSGRSCNLLDMLKALGPQADIVKLEQLTGSFRYRAERMDQTATPIGECAIEFLVRKRPLPELRAGGSLPATNRARVSDIGRLSPAHLYSHVGRLRNASITAGTESPHSVVIPLATYAPWRSTPAFLAARAAVEAHTQIDIYRCYELWNLVHQVRDVPGDVLEVGVWRGGSACLLGLAMRDAGIVTDLVLADRFDDEVGREDRGSAANSGARATASLEAAEALLKENRISDIRLLRGVFPDQTAASLADRRIRFCHIDLDLYRSAKNAFEWVWPRLAQGGILVFDDYGFRGSEGVATLVEENATRPDAVFVHNINGHAIFVKKR